MNGMGGPLRLENRTRHTVLAERLYIADSFWRRLRGLLGTAGLAAGEALQIRPCDNIHMFGMRYAIDVIFADQHGRVLKTVAELKPWSMAWCRGAAYVVELPCGALQASRTGIGDLLEIEYVES